MADSSTYVLKTQDLRRVYGEGPARVEALRGIDLAVRPGELLAITGRSGSGKSTLLSLLGGVDMPTSGEILLQGVNLASLSDDERTLIRRRQIGFIFQSFNLLPILTAEENVALPLEFDGVPSAEARRRAGKMLTLVGLYARREHIPSTLSGGEQQRVAIARALVIQPTLLLADEPTGNLDSVNGQRIADLLRNLVDEQGHTIVLVTHEARMAAQADRVIHLSDGQIETDVPQSPVPPSSPCGVEP